MKKRTIMIHTMLKKLAPKWKFAVESLKKAKLYGYLAVTTVMKRYIVFIADTKSTKINERQTKRLI